MRPVGWTMLYLFVALKLPILAAGWLIWWAVRQEPETTRTATAAGAPRGRTRRRSCRTRRAAGRTASPRRRAAARPPVAARAREPRA